MTEKLTKEQLIFQLLNLTKEQIADFIEDIHPVDILEAINEYEGDKYLLLKNIPEDIIAEIIEEAEDNEKNALLELFPEINQKSIIHEMSSDELVDMLNVVPEEKVHNILKNLEKEDFEEVRDLLLYPPDTAGGIMATEYIVVEENMNVLEVLKLLRKEGNEAETTNCLYVLDVYGKLKGVVSLKEIVTSDFDMRISEIMNENVISVPVNMDQEQVGHIFQKYRFSSLPVVNENQEMLGIITHDDIIEIVTDEDTEDFEKMAALSHNEEEYLKTGVFKHARKRILWLLILMISATLTGLVIRNFENILSAVIVLSSFIPMLMDTGGNAGSQSATLIIRGIALGQIYTKNIFSIIFKEFRVSIIVGAILSIVNFVRIILIERISITIAITVSISLFFTVMLAKIIGCILPILAKKVKIDPAIMASPLITTIVDALSLIVYFSIAKLFLNI